MELVVRNAGEGDIPEILDVIDRSFRHRYYGGVNETPNERDIFDYLYHLPGFDPGWIVVGEAGGRIVSVVGSFPRPAYIAGAAVDSWELSPAATLLEHRGHGFMVRLIAELERQVAGRGGTLLFFHGVPDYYERAGFAKCLPRYEVIIAAKRAGSGGPGLKPVERPAGETLGPAGPDDVPALAALWDREARGGCLAMIRTLDWWRRETTIEDVKRAEWIHRPFADPARLLVLTEPATGSPAPIAYAYAAEEDGRMVVTESAARDDAAAEGLLAGLGRRALERGREEFVVAAGPNSRLARAAIRRLGSLQTTRPNAGFAKVLAPGAILKSLEPALTARWVDRGGDGIGSLPLDLGRDSVSITYDPEGVVVLPIDWRPRLRLPVAALTRLVLGCATPGEDPLESLGLSRAARHVLSILFPPAYPDPGQYTF